MPPIDVSRYPYPIASTLQQVQESEHDPGLCFRNCIRAFIAVLKYCSMACVGDYVEELKAGSPGTPEINDMLRSQLYRPSLGHWNGFVRELLKRRRDAGQVPDGFFCDLNRFYFGDGDKPKKTKGQKCIDRLIAIRNEWFHPVVEPTAEELPRVLADTRDTLDELVRELAFLCEYPLVVRSRREPEATDVVELRGPDLAACPVRAWDRDGPAPDQLIILDGESGVTPVLFLIGSLETAATGEPDWLLFETADINKKKAVKRLKYLLGNTRGTDEALYIARATELRERLATDRDEYDGRESSDRTGEEIDFADCVRRLADWSSRNVKAVSGAASRGLKHDRQLYVERQSFQGPAGVFARYMAASAPCLVVLGDSGHGKTNLLCGLRGHPDAVPAEGERATLFVECSTIGSGGLAADVEYELRVENALRRIVRHLNEHPDRRLLVLLDALNEYGRPRALLQELVDAANDCSGLRIVISCRTVAWQTITQNLVFDEELFFRDDGEIPSLGQFDDAELSSAYERYSSVFDLKTAWRDVSPLARRLMRDPLLLRLTSQAYTGSEVPRDPDIPTLFANYELERKLIPRRDAPMLDDLVAVMWERGVDQLPKAWVSDVPRLEALVYEDPVDSSTEERYVCRDNGHVIVGEHPVVCPVAGCGCPDLDVSQADWRITYDRLRDEGFLVETAQDDDRAIRFVYDRYLEYRLGLWLSQRYGEVIGLATAEQLIDHVAESGREIFHSALCQMIIGPVSEEETAKRGARDALILELAQSPRSADQEMASSCLLHMVGRAEDERAERVLTSMLSFESTSEAHLVALRGAPALGTIGDVAVLAPLPPDSPELLEARNHALYSIGRRDETQARAKRLLTEFVDRVSPQALARKQFDAVHTFGEVSLRLMGVRNNDPETVAWLTDLWQRLLSERLWLGRKDPLHRAVSAGLRGTIITLGSRYLADMLESDGVMFAARDGHAFPQADEEAIRTVLGAWQPDNPAIENVPEVLCELGPESPDEEARESGTASLLSWFSILGCSFRIRTEPEEVSRVYGELFDLARDFHNHGRGTRYSVISGKNFGTMAHFSELGRERLRPVYDSVIRHWNALLEQDPEFLLTQEVFKGAPNVLCGILSESVVRMGESITDVLLVPLLETARTRELPELIRAWFKVTPVALNSWSRDYPLYDHFLKSLVDEKLHDARHVSREYGLPEEQARRWFHESLAILSMGYPTAVDAWIQEAGDQGSAILDDVYHAKARPSEVLHCVPDVTLAAEYQRLVGRWTFADASVHALNKYEPLRSGLRDHILKMFEYSDARSYFKYSVRTLLQHLVDGDLRKLAELERSS